MKILQSISNVFYVAFMLTVVFIVFNLPRCKAQDRYYTADDFRSSKQRGLMLSRVQTLQELTDKKIPEAKTTGANHGRIWIRIKHDANNVYTYEKPDALKTIDSAVRMAEKINYPLILTVEVLPRQGECDWWGSTARKDGIIKKWVELATRYKSKKIIMAYDLMNEPRRNPRMAGSTKEYIDFTIKIIKAIRAVDPNHAIAVEVLHNEMLADPYMSAIVPIKNLIYSPHGYSPLSITHQGEGSNTKRRPFPDPTSTNYNSTTYFSRVSYWKAPADFARKYNVPLWFGEFSCINWAPKNAQGLWSSTVWIESAIKYMESIGASWTYHAWREYQGWDAQFPSSWYEGQVFTNAKPASLPPSSARSDNTPTMSVLKKWFAKNVTL